MLAVHSMVVCVSIILSSLLAMSVRSASNKIKLLDYIASGAVEVC